MAKLLGWSRAAVWRAKLLATLPEDLFERLLATKATSTRELAIVARVLAGDRVRDEERCPHCGLTIRARGLRPATIKVLNEWLADR